MKLFYKQYSSKGEPLVFLHGLFGNQGNWLQHAKRLSEHYSVYALDARNHGRSDWYKTMSYHEMALDVIETMSQLRMESAHFIGHSMGGKTLMQLALLKPGILKKIIVVDIAPISYPSGSQSVLQALQQVDLNSLGSRKEANEQLALNIEQKSVRSFLLTNLKRDTQGKYLWRFNLEALVNCHSQITGGLEIEELNQYQQEVLFIKGEDSDYLQWKDKDAILNIFPKARMKVIAGTGHWVHSEKPEAFIKIVENYLSSVPEQSSN